MALYKTLELWSLALAARACCWRCQTVLWLRQNSNVLPALRPPSFTAFAIVFCSPLFVTTNKLY